MQTIDLNADAGESFGPWPMGDDAGLFPLLSSVNLACGFHAGDPVTMRTAVQLARETGVAVGAHPGFPDLAGFGRRDMALRADELYAAVLYQLGALDAFLRAEGLRMRHVKAHGALYLRMAQDEATAAAVAKAVRDFAEALPVVVLGGPGGRVMQEAVRAQGLRPVLEAFPDRAYLADGRLAPRSAVGALVRDPEEAADRAVRMATGADVPTLGGGETRVEAQTLCIHGDHPEAVETARAVRRALEAAGVGIRAF